MKKSHVFFVFFLGFIILGFIKQTSIKFGTPPKELPALDTSVTSLTWNTIIEAHFDYLRDTTLHEPYIVQATFGGVSGWAGPSYEDQQNKKYGKGYLFEPKIYNFLVKKFYKSPVQQSALYKWTKPYYLEAFKKLPYYKKQMYRDMVKHAKKYIAEFNYKSELEIYKKYPNFFHCKSPKGGHRGRFGRMEAFIFRRVHNHDMTLQQMLNWINIIQKDIANLS